MVKIHKKVETIVILNRIGFFFAQIYLYTYLFDMLDKLEISTQIFKIAIIGRHFWFLDMSSRILEGNFEV